MPAYTLRCQMLAEQSREQVFRVFEDPYNLAKITPPWLTFQVTSDERVTMRRGAKIDYTIRWLGLPMKWKTLIKAYNPPNLFIDEQEKGPYTLWRHTHTFEETAEGTLVGDRVDYQLPFGVLGQLAHVLLVKRQLLGIFRYRQQTLPSLLQAPARQIVAPYITRMMPHQIAEPAWQTVTLRS